MSSGLRCSVCILAFLACVSIPMAGCTPSAAPNEGRSVPAALDTPLMHVMGRTRIDLSGDWRYIVDPVQLGLRKPGSRIRNFAADAQATGNELIEYDFEHSPRLRVPGDWNSQVKELTWYEGLIWYRTRFSAQPRAGYRYFVYFEGANYLSRVYLNGTALGTHEGGFTPFAFDVTESLQTAENSLVVAVDNTRSEQAIPAWDYDWFNYGGITRPVHLVEVPETYIHDYRVWLEERAGEPVVLVDVHIQGDARAGQEVTLDVAQLGVAMNGQTDGSGRVRFEFAGTGVARWSPGQPTLYEFSLSTDRDRIDESIGLRTIEVVGQDILLNGEPVYLKGISLHEEVIGDEPNRTLDWDEAEALLELAKELGCNFVRLAHYPHSEKVTRLADRMGLLLWSEIPIWQEVDFANPHTLAVAQRMLAENIGRDKNRASIVVWSVANETPDTAERLVFLKTLIEDVRAADPTRLVSSALHKNTVKGNTTIVEDPLGEYLDLIAVNEYQGWYGRRTPGEIEEVSWESAYDKPMIFSEFGAGALHGFRADRDTRWSEEYQRYVYEENLRMAERVPFLRGISPWILKDFRTPRRFHSRFQNYWNRKGLVSETGQKKLAFFTLQRWYREHGAGDSGGSE